MKLFEYDVGGCKQEALKSNNVYIYVSGGVIKWRMGKCGNAQEKSFESDEKQLFAFGIKKFLLLVAFKDSNL
ncbi:CLUMA_CG001769, isoform A [Clunio marinus]|uniref:CLUMA_CG001769, isoform A n=1 Tax=Clunio marinus TaxID=568069 RepID=A0A1J1HIW7_9DIPT|nr:CLUMA_CG001769, isoform A [Clunio marinus]